NLTRGKGFCEALRAADYLNYPFPELRLHIVGAGPFESTLRRFRKATYFGSNVHLEGSHARGADRLATAEVCWVPSLSATGRQVALEALAAGTPVIASDLPHLREIIGSENGLLVRPGSPIALAQAT